MREKAVVKELKENNMAVVEVLRSTACDSCGACGVGRDKLLVRAEVENFIGAQVGDEVDVEMEFGGFLSASFIAYGIPFALFLVGLFLGFYVMPNIIPLNENLLGFTFGALFMGITYLIIRNMDRKGAFKEKFKIWLVR